MAVRSWEFKSPPGHQVSTGSRSGSLFVCKKGHLLIGYRQELGDDLTAIGFDVGAFREAQALGFTREFIEALGLTGRRTLVVACTDDEHWTRCNPGDVFTRIEGRSVERPVEQDRQRVVKRGRVDAPSQLRFEPQSIIRCAMNQHGAKDARIPGGGRRRERNTEARADDDNPLLIGPFLLHKLVGDQPHGRYGVQDGLATLSECIERLTKASDTLGSVVRVVHADNGTPADIAE